MKKVLVIALMLGAGFAFASTLGVPWFVDNAPVGVNPPAGAKSLAFIYIHNNHTDALEVTLEYYTENGIYIGPTTGNTFNINPQASLAFRPVKLDTVFEGADAQLIPDRPRTTVAPSTSANDLKQNGSCVFTWLGPASYLTGSYQIVQVGAGPTSPTDTTVIYRDLGWGHVLPPGA